MDLNNVSKLDMTDPKAHEKFEQDFKLMSNLFSYQKSSILGNNLLQIFAGWLYLPIPYCLKKYIEWTGSSDGN